MIQDLKQRINNSTINPEEMKEYYNNAKVIKVIK